MRSVFFLVPGRIEARTGGSMYDRRIAEGLRDRGWAVDVRELDASFPFPGQAALAHADEVLASLPDRGLVVVDGLAFGAMPDAVERYAARLRLVALVHLPLSSDASFDRDTAARFEAAERRALACARLVIVTSPVTLSLMARYDLPSGRIAVVEPGTDRAPLACGSQDACVHLLSVGTLNPGKGHEVLLQALAKAPPRGWRLTCAGSLTRHPATAARVRAAVHGLGLEDRVSLVGELGAEALETCYDSADLFVLATRQETYGMAVAEALAHGLPVVSTTTGAIPALVGDEAGLLVPPGDVDALAAVLTRVLTDAGLRARLADGARRARERLPSWDEASEKMSTVLEHAG